MAYHYIKLRVRHVKCIRDQSWWDPDDIAIGGVAIYPDFHTKKISPVSLGEFSEGASRNVRRKVVGMTMHGGDSVEIKAIADPPPGSPPNSVSISTIQPFRHDFGTMNLPDGSNAGVLSKRFAAVIFMSEVDLGGFSGWIDEYLHPVVRRVAGDEKRQVVDSLQEGMLPTNEALAPSMKQIKELAIGALLAGGPFFGDDIFFGPAYISRDVSTYHEFPNGRRDTDNASFYFTEELLGVGAKYRLRMDWYKYGDYPDVAEHEDLITYEYVPPPMVHITPTPTTPSMRRVEVVSQTATGRNTLFREIATGRVMSRSEFVTETQKGAYPDYYVRSINGLPTPVSKPNADLSDNLG